MVAFVVMRPNILLLIVVMALSVDVPAADQAGSRAWQQRLELEMPLQLPLLEVAPDNPFAVPLDRVPERREATPPRKLGVAGRAVVAVYVDGNGACLGAVPLEVPFPGLTAGIVAGFADARFEPARVGKGTQPSWVVVEVLVDGTVKEAGLVTERLEVPDPVRPAEPATPVELTPSGQLANLPFAPAEAITAAALPKRISFKVPSREVEVPVRALVRVSPSGRCDRYVPLELDSGLASWLETFLASWVLEPGQREGTPVEAWVLYTARARMELSSLSSGSYRVLRDRTYSPAK